MGDVCFSQHGGIRTEGAWQGAEGALQPEAARPQAGESLLLRHNSTLILIESGYCYFYQKPQYFWAFQRFKADLGPSGKAVYFHGKSFRWSIKYRIKVFAATDSSFLSLESMLIRLVIIG